MKEQCALVSRHDSLDLLSTWTRFVRSPNARHSLSNACAPNSPDSSIASCGARREVAIREETTKIVKF